MKPPHHAHPKPHFEPKHHFKKARPKHHFEPRHHGKPKHLAKVDDFKLDEAKKVASRIFRKCLSLFD